MSAQSFATLAVVHEGKLRLKDRGSLIQWMRKVGDGVELLVELSEKKDKRSLAQNRTLHGPIYDQILTGIMTEQGFRQDEILGSFEINKAKRLIHYGLLAKRFGHEIDPVTKESVPARTSSELNTKEMAEYFEWLVMYCADELHIQVVLPDEAR